MISTCSYPWQQRWWFTMRVMTFCFTLEKRREKLRLINSYRGPCFCHATNCCHKTCTTPDVVGPPKARNDVSDKKKRVLFDRQISRSLDESLFLHEWRRERGNNNKLIVKDFVLGPWKNGFCSKPAICELRWSISLLGRLYVQVSMIGKIKRCAWFFNPAETSFKWWLVMDEAYFFHKETLVLLEFMKLFYPFFFRMLVLKNWTPCGSPIPRPFS